jgi:ribonuclease HII
VRPNFYYEKRLWKKGFKYVAGLDEVGRGSFAGPIVAASVVFARKFQIPNDKLQKEKMKIDDSKKLTELQRQRADKWIKDNAVGWGVGRATVGEINRLGMAKAASSAFRRTVANANIRMHARVEYLLIDTFFVPYIRGLPMRHKKARKNHKLKDSNARQLAIINGDEKSFSIAAASIVAKVARDELMKNLGKKRKYKNYRWENNKGYGTNQHQEAILKDGATRHHRKQFVDTFLSRSKTK